MSGRKTRTVDAAYLQDLERKAAKLRAVDTNLAGTLDSIRREMQERLRSTQQELERRQNSFDQKLSNVSQETRDIEQRTSRMLREQATALKRQDEGHKRDHQHLRDAIDETREVMDAQARELRGCIEKERAERQRDINAMDERISTIEQTEEAARQEAIRLLADAEVFGAAIGSELPHQRYFPNELSKIQSEIAEEKARASRFGQSAMTGARALVRRLSDLRIKTEEKDLEWKQAQFAALEAARGLQAVIANNQIRTVSFDGEDNLVWLEQPLAGNEQDAFELDVDYWSHGSLSECVAELDELIAGIEDVNSPMGLNELKDALIATIPRLDSRFRDTVQHAGANLLLNHTRVSMADVIAESLEEYYFTPVESGWAGNDERKSYVTKLVDQAGNSIVVIAGNELEINQYDGPGQPVGARAERDTALRSLLNDRGLPMGGLGSEQAEPDRSKLDVSAILKQGLSDQQPAVAVNQPQTRPQR